ncbi:hypothetical protein [Roseateles asaccharophilus]|uniref:Uncharacterized protein n=1 Tax=Roseateles asaccharophilus TaxID=582607 RepID=A0ABU2A6X8_9BURK|nr:hypothetical protein [Roseateles asaccharophilus]MDR7332959.1 hypothetical protein [Roseateles asaccharophilus]
MTKIAVSLEVQIGESDLLAISAPMVAEVKEVSAGAATLQVSGLTAGQIEALWPKVKRVLVHGGEAKAEGAACEYSSVALRMGVGVFTVTKQPDSFSSTLWRAFDADEIRRLIDKG